MALEKRIIVNTSIGHNKFWMLIPHPTNSSLYDVRNGRLGTNGQLQKKPLSQWEGTQKLQDKIRDGYRYVSDKEFERLNTQAAIVGSTNKCEILQWVERRGPDNKQLFYPVSDDYLADPNYNPLLLVSVSTRKEIGGDTKFWLLFSPEESFELQCTTTALDSGITYYMGIPTPVSRELKKLSNKVEIAMGRLFG